MSRSGFYKFITRAAIVVLLLLFVFYGFLKYRQYDSYDGMIHKNADVIIKINSDQLIRKIAYNTLTNPSFYFQSAEEDSTSADEDDDDRARGFTLPANLFVYTLKGDLKTFYTTLKVYDSASLKAFVQNTLGINSFTTFPKYSYAYSDNRKVQMVFNNETVTLAYTFKGEDLQASLQQILLQKETMPADSDVISALKSADGDAVVLQGNNIANIDFENGKVVLSGFLNPDPEIEFPSTASLARIDTSASVHLGIFGNVPTPFLKSYKLNDITIPLDSLAKNYEGYLDLRVAGTAIQHDTIITYDYNDDFEKVEVKTVSESEVPGVNVVLRGKAANMMDLLKKERIALHNKLNRNVFPLLDLNIRENGASELVFTNLKNDPKPDYASSQDFFMLYMNFQRLAQQKPWFAQVNYFKNLKRLNISASRIGQNINVKGQLLLNDEDINALMQLIDY